MLANFWLSPFLSYQPPPFRKIKNVKDERPEGIKDERKSRTEIKIYTRSPQSNVPVLLNRENPFVAFLRSGIT